MNWLGEGKTKLRIGIVGMGYVGLPLALQFSKNGNYVLGLDIDREKVQALNEGQSYIRHISASAIQEMRRQNLFEATDDFTKIRSLDAILICVPTPLGHHREPDIGYIVSTGKKLGPDLQPGQLISLESTTYPGTTDEDLRRVLEAGSGLVAGRDFLLAYSPEREDPGNPDFGTARIPKVVGGLTEESLQAACYLYNRAGITTIPVSSCRTAEAVKLLENIFRSVNIALVNELKLVFERMKIDIWEVVDAAKTKPFGYMPFYPGPGLGGHCIPIDPFYLTWKAREYGLSTRFIELAGEINTSMPEYVVQRLQDALSAIGKPMKNAKILLLGMAYKKNVDDDRESPSYTIWEMLVQKGCEVCYHDPYVPVIKVTREHPDLVGIRSVDLTPETISAIDAVLIVTDHTDVDYGMIAEHAPLIVDTRNACRNIPAERKGQKYIKA